MKNLDFALKYVPLTLFCIFVVKLLIVGAALVDAPVLLILAALAGFYEYAHQGKALAVVHKRCDEVDKHLTALYKANQELKNELSTAKLGQQFQKVGGINR